MTVSKCDDNREIKNLIKFVQPFHGNIEEGRTLLSLLPSLYRT